MGAIKLCSIAGLGLLGISAPVMAAIPPIAITEYEYNGSEFVEFTNMSGAPINMATDNWAFDDSDPAQGKTSLAAFGIVQPGESVVMSEVAEATFRTQWPGMSPLVKVIGSNGNNLGRADTINLYMGTTVIDSLMYDDQTLGGVRTDVNAAGPKSDAVLGTNVITNWDFTKDTGNPHGMPVLTSASNFKGNPGAYVPEPTSAAVIVLSGLVFIQRRKRS